MLHPTMTLNISLNLSGDNDLNMDVFGINIELEPHHWSFLSIWLGLLEDYIKYLQTVRIIVK